MNRVLFALLPAAFLLLAAPLPARALWGDTEGAIGIDGSFRTLGFAVDNYENPLIFGLDNDGDALSQSLLRLVIAGRPAGWLSYEIHGVQSVNAVTNAGGSAGVFSLATGGAMRFEAVEAVWNQDDHDEFTAALFLDRLAVKFALPHVDVTVGRQAITLGKAYFWNPLDIFLAFDPRQFDRDYKGGVDAVRVDVEAGAFSGLSFIAAAGRTINSFGEFVDHKRDALPSRKDLDADYFGSALLGRAFTTWEGWDLAVQGGKVYGGYQIGGGLSGEFKTIEVRAEAAYLWAMSGPPFYILSRGKPLDAGELFKNALTAVVGVGRRFESTLQIEAEYLYNGAGDPDFLERALARVSTGGSFHASRNVLGVVATYEILPIVLGQMAALISLDDGSLQLQPGVTWSVSDNVDFLVGGIVSLGRRPRGVTSLGNPRLHSEFGTYPDFYYAELKAYF